MSRCYYGNHIAGTCADCPACAKWNRIRALARANRRAQSGPADNAGQFRSQPRPSKRRKPYFYNPSDRD